VGTDFPKTSCSNKEIRPGYRPPAPGAPGHLTPSFSAIPANPEYYHARIHPALTSLADEHAATLARLIAYAGARALLGIVGLHLWTELPAAETVEPAGKPAGTWHRARARASPSARLIRPKNQRLTRSVDTPTAD